MEDKHIFKGEYCYSFRIDIDWKDPQKVEIVTDKLREYFTRYRLSQENKKDGTEHLQGILWREKPLGKTQPQQIRTYFKQKFKLQRGGHSLVSAKKVKSLAAYCSDKEQKGYHDYNIPQGIDLGKWENLDAEKEVLKDKYRQKLHELEFTVDICGYGEEDKHMEMYKHQLRYRVLKFALEHIWTKECKHTPPPIKTLLSICRQEGVIDDDQFIYTYYNI